MNSFTISASGTSGNPSDFVPRPAVADAAPYRARLPARPSAVVWIQSSFFVSSARYGVPSAFSCSLVSQRQHPRKQVIRSRRLYLTLACISLYFPRLQPSIQPRWAATVSAVRRSPQRLDWRYSSSSSVSIRFVK